MARRLQDQDNKELESILQTLLEQDVAITAREVCRRHTSLTSASTITRHPARRQLLESLRKQQADLRQWRTKLGKRSKEQTANLVTLQEAKVLELDHAVRTLVTYPLSPQLPRLEAWGNSQSSMSVFAKFAMNYRA